MCADAVQLFTFFLCVLHRVSLANLDAPVSVEPLALR